MQLTQVRLHQSTSLFEFLLRTFPHKSVILPGAYSDSTYSSYLSDANYFYLPDANNYATLRRI